VRSPLLSLDKVRLPRGTLLELSVEFGPGVHVITGPNGIGKTSLLNTIAGSLPLVSGAIRFDGKALDHGAARVVLAPNVPPAIPWIRSGLLLDFIVSLYTGTRCDPQAASDIVARLGVASGLDAAFGTLSAGMARKLLLAAALVAAPPVMLFDEPTNDIDAASSDAFVDLVRGRAATAIVIITTHHVGDLMSLNPRVLPLAVTSEMGSGPNSDVTDSE
jgi:ABC-2 type transport system ATP-binding protein